jgi:hypothetical protein
VKSLFLSKSDEFLDVQVDRYRPSEDDTTKRMPCKGSSSSGEYSGWNVI